MPKRCDLNEILIIGSGPIVIGQACEFDYSGTQACKSLKEEGYKIVLVNSNPATIMTDPEFADKTYIEPLTVEVLEEIIRRERPDAILPTLGGQTALNLAMALHENGSLEKYGVEMIGASSEAIKKAEDRDLFKQAMRNINLDVPRSESVHSLQEARDAGDRLGGFPLVIRPGFTLGGVGGGIAYSRSEFDEIASRGLRSSPTSEVLIEECIAGWKEFELEVMRDCKDNCIVICSIENVDPMGVHTGDSITVAPAQTLTDREYQILRDASLAVMREIGVETGGSNVQFAINPIDGRLVIIEMNPRVSRSSALASKATGFPIAKIAAKLAVGYTLDEIRNDITRETPASFEPSIDYVVTKIPRFTFEKFPNVDDTLGTQMKSVGETMSIGKTFKQSLQKALRSLEIGRYGFGADGNDEMFESLSDNELEALLRRPNAVRLFAVRAAFKRAWSIATVHEYTKIDRWFLNHLEELAYFEEEIRSVGKLEELVEDPALFRQAKEFGYSDIQIAYLLGASEDDVRDQRKKIDINPVYALVDTCAAEFLAYTPYYYSTYGDLEEASSAVCDKIMILGGGPNRIGQGIEFDYCCVHASYALQEAGIESIMVNSNPETVSTDYDTSDRLYFEPLTLEDVLHIYETEKCRGVIVQFGGQTPLNLARELQENGVNILGTKPESIEAVEDRKFFQELADKLNILQTSNGTASTTSEALSIARDIGYPVLVRPSFVLGGRAMVIVEDEDGLRKYMDEAVTAFKKRPVLIDSYLDGALEVDVDCVSDGETVVVGAIMEHVEFAGVHSGDSACIIPAPTLSENVKQTIRQHCTALAIEIQVVGLMNVQFAIKEECVYILEVNPRASRTIPFVSKAIGMPLAKIATLVITGKKLPELGFTEEIIPKYYSVKEAVFPFIRFPGSDITLTPEMRSTGEVMGIDDSPAIGFLKSQVAAGTSLPTAGNIFLSVRDSDKAATVPTAIRLIDLGYAIYSTHGTSLMLKQNGITSVAINKISDEREPNILNMIAAGDVKWIINTPDGGVNPRMDEIRMRAESVAQGIPITTTLNGLVAAVSGLEAMKGNARMEVRTLQEYHEKNK